MGKSNHQNGSSWSSKHKTRSPAWNASEHPSFTLCTSTHRSFQKMHMWEPCLALLSFTGILPTQLQTIFIKGCIKSNLYNWKMKFPEMFFPPFSGTQQSGRFWRTETTRFPPWREEETKPLHRPLPVCFKANWMPWSLDQFNFHSFARTTRHQSKNNDDNKTEWRILESWVQCSSLSAHCDATVIGSRSRAGLVELVVAAAAQAYWLRQLLRRYWGEKVGTRVAVHFPTVPDKTANTPG